MYSDKFQNQNSNSINDFDKSYKYSEYFADFFQARQLIDYSWDSPIESDQNQISKIVYTCQVLLALKECLIPTDEIENMAIKGIKFLETSKPLNPLFDNLLILKSLNVWNKFTLIDSLKEQTIYKIENKTSEFGGRFDSYTFELAFSLEVLLDCDLYSHLSEKTKNRLESILNLMLQQNPEYFTDISHYSWLVDIKLRLGRPSIDTHIRRFTKSLNNYTFNNGLWVDKSDWDKPTNTPALCCNEFLTAHIIISCSRILKERFYEKLYSLLREPIRYFVNNFSLDNLWITGSQSSAKHSADPYMSALILRALTHFADISDSSYRLSIGLLEGRFNNMNQDNQIMRVGFWKKKKSKKYMVYDNKNGPIPIYNRENLIKYTKISEKYDILIIDPFEYYHLGKKLTKRPRRVSRDLLRVILKSRHKGFVHLRDLYIATGKNIKNDSDLTNEEFLKPLRNDLSECQKPFGRCINPKENPGFWEKEGPNPKFVFVNDYNSCLIEEVENTKD